MKELLAKLKQLESERAVIDQKITAIQKVIELFNETPVKNYLTEKKKPVKQSYKPLVPKGTVEDAIEYATDLIELRDAVRFSQVHDKFKHLDKPTLARAFKKFFTRVEGSYNWTIEKPPAKPTMVAGDGD